MKKQVLLGALAFFAIGAMSIHNAVAQEPVKKEKAEKAIEKKEVKEAEAVEMKADCCKEAKAGEKKADCCKEAKVGEKKADCCKEAKPADAKKGHKKASQKEAKRSTENVK